MSVESSRRSRLSAPVPPVTWELPALVGAAGSCVLAMVPLVVQALCAKVIAGTVAWPDLLIGLNGLAHGRFGDGLRPSVADRLPPDLVLWGLTAVVEVVALGGVALVALWSRTVIGVGPNRGLATAAQARTALGRRQLQRKAAVIRPDLAGVERRRKRSR